MRTFGGFSAPRAGPDLGGVVRLASTLPHRRQTDRMNKGWRINYPLGL